MLMVLGFLVGLVPSSSIRTEAGTSSGDHIDMVGLLDLVMGGGSSAKATGNVTVSSEIQGILIKTPSDNFQTPEIPVPVQGGIANGNGSELLSFVANKENDATAFPRANRWKGSVYTEPVASPYIGTLDVGSFVTGVAGTTTNLAVYGLVNATASVESIYTLTYSDATTRADRLPLTIQETNGQVDTDKNGLPDNPFAGLAQNQYWISNQVVNNQLRTVLVANLDDGAKAALGTVYTSPTGNVTVDSPDLAQFKAAGAIGANESGYLIIQVVSNLAGAIDAVYNNASTVAQWAQSVSALQPGALVTGGQYVEISLVYTLYNGTQYDEIDNLPPNLAINLTMQGLTPGANTTVGLYDYPTRIDSSGASVIVTNDPNAPNAWTEVPNATFAGGAITASLTSLSVFAPLGTASLPPISISGATPNQVPEHVAVPVTINGVFPTLTALNAAQAAAAYAVYVGGSAAAFREVAGVAISAYTNGGSNSANVTVPAINAPGFYDVTVTDKHNPSNTATRAGLIEVKATTQLNTQVTGGTGTITVNPTSSTGLPAGLYYTGTAISASLVYVYNGPGGQVTFNRWLRNGVLAGNDPSNVNIVVGDVANSETPTTLTAELIKVITEQDFALTATAGAGGSVQVLTQPNGTVDTSKYISGTVVTVKAVPNAGYRFTNWTGPVDLATTATTTLTITADTAISANFTKILYPVSVAVTNGQGGTVQILTPPDGPNNTYFLGTIITIQATPNAGYEFVNWEGADAGLLDDSGAAQTSFTVDGNQPSYSFTADFIVIPPCPTGPQITGISPANAWLFGGVVARISGTCIPANAIITIGGQTVGGFRRFSDGSSIDVVIPPSTNTDTNLATIPVDVTVSDGVNPASELPNGFTYKRYETKDSVNTTAFILPDPSAANTVEVALDATLNDKATLQIPALQVPAGVTTVFGIARDAFNEITSDKANTPSIGALGTDNIAAGNPVNGVPDFSLHLYAGSESAKANTPSVGAGTLTSASGLINFGPPIDANGNPTGSTPLLLSFPLAADAPITYGDVKNSLSLWGVETSYDYITDTTTVTQPENTAYQSELLNNEVEQNLIPGSTSDSAKPNMVANARIYSLNGFSLRKGAVLPSDVASQIHLATASGTASGALAGGTPLRIISPGGGLAHIDRVVFTQAVAAKAVGGTVTQASLITVPGTTENEVQFNTPASSQAGIANIVIYGKADPNTPIVQLDRVFEYKGTTIDLTALLLLALGVLVAGLGLAAGGHSGGGSSIYCITSIIIITCV